MRKCCLSTAAVLLQVMVATGLAIPCSAQPIPASRFEGLWESDPGQKVQRWVDIRVLERPGGTMIHAWWSCRSSDGCRYYGPLTRDNSGGIEIIAYRPDWKSLVRIGLEQDWLSVFEEIAFANGGGEKSSQLLHRISDPPGRNAAAGADSPPAASISNGGTRVRTAGGEFGISPPDPNNRPERLQRESRRDADGQERQTPKLDIQRLQPPYNPDDPNLQWVSEYNILLQQILAFMLRPDNLNNFLQTETDNPYDRFVRRSQLIDVLTQPR